MGGPVTFLRPPRRPLPSPCPPSPLVCLQNEFLLQAELFVGFPASVALLFKCFGRLGRPSLERLRRLVRCASRWALGALTAPVHSGAFLCVLVRFGAFLCAPVRSSALRCSVVLCCAMRYGVVRCVVVRFCAFCVLLRSAAFWLVLVRSCVLLCVLVRSCPLWCVLVRSGAFLCVVVCSGAFWCVLFCSGALLLHVCTYESSCAFALV